MNKEFNITIKNYIRDIDWWKDPKNNLMNQNVENNNFVDINKNNLQIGDMLFFQIRGKFANHVAVSLGNDLILHHVYGKISRREPMHRLMKFCTRYLRSKELC